MKKLLVILSVMVGLASCNGGKSFKINVNLDNSNGKTVYLQRYVGDVLKTLDSVVAKDNIAVFKVKKSDNLDALHIMINGWRRPVVFFADNQDVTITGDYQKAGAIKILASENQKNLEEFETTINKIEDEQELFYTAMRFVKENIENTMAPYVLYRYKWAFPYEDMKKLYESISPDMQSGYKYAVLKYIKDLQRVQPGNPYINFTQKDVNGNDFTMSSVIGKSKVIILDFWASWCPDCRKENPNMVALYNEFKDRGLDIVSVSLDTDEAAWKKAIEDDKLSWPIHVSDLQGWKNSVAAEYCIAFIPQNIVLDNNGNILEKNLSYDKLREVASRALR